MKSSAILPAVLAGLGIVLFAVVLVLGGGTVLYEASDDAFSPVQKDPSAISVMTTEEAETILPLMAEIMLQSLKTTTEIGDKDFEFSERELKEYENLVNRLKTNNAKIKLGNTEINDFRISSEELKIALEILNSDVERLEEVKKEIRENSGDTSALASLYAEVQALSREISLTADSYAETAEKMIAVSKNHNLDTSALEESIISVNKLASSSTNNAGSIRPGGSSVLEILFTISGDTFAYGDTLVIEGRSERSGLHDIYLDSKPWGTVNLTEPGFFTKSFKITNIPEGDHSIFIRSQGGVSKFAYFSVVSTPTEIFISSVKVRGNTVTILGGLQTIDGLSVSDAKVDVYADGIGLLSTNTTNKNGVFTVQTELENGKYQVTAAFSDLSFPLDESVSELVMVNVAESFFLLILGVAVLGVAAFISVRFIRKRKSVPVEEIPEHVIVDSLPVSVHASPVKKVVKAIRRMLDSSVKKEDIDRLRVLYHETILVIASQEGIENTAAKTPREILQSIKHQRENIIMFITEYEYLHYADVSVSDEVFERMRVLSTEILERYHENNE